jgi:hypothetical protein
VIRNDTYGDITREELADLRLHARPCSTCGMLATVDPVFHASRYGHAPTVRPDRSGARTSFDWSLERLGWVQL